MTPASRPRPGPKPRTQSQQRQGLDRGRLPVPDLAPPLSRFEIDTNARNGHGEPTPNLEVEHRVAKSATMSGAPNSHGGGG